MYNILFCANLPVRAKDAFNDVLVVPFSNFGAETRIDSWCDTQYKFIVDGEWKYAPDQPAMYDEMGNVNNVLEVQVSRA